MPPAPVHESEYVVVAEGVTEAMPLVVPAVKPVPVHELTLVEDQLRVDELPLTTVVGLAENVSVGTGVTDTVTPTVVDA